MLRRTLGNSAGMTLNELLTVISIIGILAVVAVPQFNQWLHRFRADAEVNKLYFDLMAAKSTAIRSNSDVIISFDSGSNSYTIHNDLDRDGAVNGSEVARTVIFDSEMKYGIPSGALGVWGNSVSDPIALGGTSVTFQSRGQASTSGAIYLIPVIDDGSSIKTRGRAIKIIQATGAVEVMHYDASASPGPWS